MLWEFEHLVTRDYAVHVSHEMLTQDEVAAIEIVDFIIIRMMYGDHYETSFNRFG